MDLRTSRRPPLVPRVVRAPDSFADPLERAVAVELGHAMGQDELVRRVAAPRSLVWAATRRLTLAGVLETPRAEAMASGGAGWKVGGVWLDEVGEAIVGAQMHRLAELGVRVRVGGTAGDSELADVAAILDALAEPLETGLTPVWARFVESERFSTRAAFGLPEAPDRGESERFHGDLEVLMRGLADLGPGLDLDALRLLDGQAVPGSLPSLREARGDLVDATVIAALGALGDRAATLFTRSMGGALARVLLADRRALTGRGGPRAVPPWLSERDEA